MQRSSNASNIETACAQTCLWTGPGVAECKERRQGYPVKYARALDNVCDAKEAAMQCNSEVHGKGQGSCQWGSG